MARATADETPVPIPLLVDCRTSITQGNTSEAPASASDPSFPRKNPSNVTMPVNASRLSTLGADSFISVVKIGPSSIRLVRAAAGAGAGFVGAGTGVETVAVWLLIGRSFPRGAGAALETNRLQEPGGCINGPTSPLLSKLAVYPPRSEEHTSELQSPVHLVCRHQL